MQPESISKLAKFAAEIQSLKNATCWYFYGVRDKPRQGFAPFGGLVQSVQDEIKEIAASDTITRIKKPVERKFEEIQQEAKHN